MTKHNPTCDPPSPPFGACWAHKHNCSSGHNLCVSALPHVQASHDEAHAKCSDSTMGMKIEPQMVLRDDSGPVCYRLAVIIFRTGGMSNGHFYIAAPTTTGMWTILNNQTSQKPISLRELKRVEGKNAHGMMYVRSKAPTTDDWGCLNTTGSMLGSVNQIRFAAICLPDYAPRQGFREW